MPIRQSTPADLPAILAIYNEVIATSTAIYLDEPVTLASREAWLADKNVRGFPLLVVDDGGDIAGFASYGDFRPFHGYRFTVEHSVHVASAHRGKGLGRALVLALLPLARAQGKHVMLGAIDGDNEASIRFHQQLGFEQTARMPQLGYKFGRWLDLVIMQKRLDG